MLLPFAAAIVGMHAPSAQADSSDIIYACQYYRTKQEAGDGWVHVVDMRMVKHPDGTWTLERANEAAVTATAVDAGLGKFGGSLSLRWREKGKERMAYLSFAAVPLPGSLQILWLNFDHPLSWQLPGYVCQTGEAGS